MKEVKSGVSSDEEKFSSANKNNHKYFIVEIINARNHIQINIQFPRELTIPPSRHQGGTFTFSLVSSSWFPSRFQI